MVKRIIHEQCSVRFAKIINQIDLTQFAMWLPLRNEKKNKTTALTKLSRINEYKLNQVVWNQTIQT